MKRISGILGLALLATAWGWAGSAHAEYTVNDDLGTSSTLVSTSVSPIASTQTTSIIAGNIGSALGGGFGGGPLAQGPGGNSGISLADRQSSSRSYLNTRELAGRAAGGGEVRFGAWIQGAYTWIDNTQSGGEFDGDVANLLAGLDYKATDDMVVGVALGYENIDIDTEFNSGTFEGDGITISPYLGVNLSRNWRASVGIGYTDLSYDTSNGLNNRTGSFDAERVFGTASVDGSYRYDKIRISPTLGVLYMKESQDGYTDSAGGAVASQDLKLGRVSAGGTVGYLLGTVEPYAKLVGEYDFERPDAVALGNGQLSHNGKTGAIVGLGLNVMLSDTIAGNIEGSYNTLGREDLDVFAAQARLNWDF